MNTLVKYSLRPSLVIFGVPLNRKNNPIYAILFADYVSISITNRSRKCLEPPHVNRIIRIIEEELGEKLEISICVEKTIRYLPYISYYSVLTSAFSLFLSELLELDIIDITESLMGVETELFDHDIIQFIQSLRLSTINDKPLLYRYGEEPIVIDNPRNCFVSIIEPKIPKIEEPLMYRVEDVDNELSDLMTKIAGLTVIKAYNSIHKHENISLLNTCCRFENMIWYVEYNLNPPTTIHGNNFCVKWIPNIGRPIQIMLSLSAVNGHKSLVKALC